MAHLTLATNERAFNKIVERATEVFAISHSDSGSFGPFSASYSAGVRLEGGKVDLQSDGSIKISELDVIYDPLQVTLGLDIPTVSIGGFCIIPTPFGCALRAPKITLFAGNPDISVPINLSGLIRSEISGAFKLLPKYFINPAKGTLSDHDAHDANKANEWQLYLDPVWIDIDLIDVADTVGSILDGLADSIINNFLSWAPGWARGIVRRILSPVISLIRSALDFADDVDEWISNLLGVSLGLFDFVVQMVAEFFASRNSIFKVEDPFKMLDGSGTLIPILVPVRDLSIAVNENEMVISTNIG
ncbi:MAG: hypothetical protein INR73_17650 [Williamsia sp.]|nr:hypothetical protein [Williamsia sp.]